MINKTVPFSTQPGQELNGRTIVVLTVETYTVRFIVLGASFVSNILLARLLGPEGKGHIATLLFWSSMLASLLLFGVDSASIYFVGKSPGRFSKLARAFLVYAFAAALAGAGALHFINHSFRDQPALVWCASGLILTALLTSMFNSLYIGLGRLSLTNRVSAAGSVLYLLLIVVLFGMRVADTGLVLQGILATQLLTSAGLVIYALFGPQFKEAAKFNWLALGRYAFKVYLGNLAGLLYFRSNFMILSLSASMSEVGIYSIAQIFADVILILPIALINIIFPKVAAMSREQAIQRVSETARFTVVLTLIMAIVISLVAIFLVPLAFGKAFQSAVGMIWILCLGAWLAAGGMVLSIYFNGTNKPGVPSSAAWIGFVAAALLTVVMAPSWGGYGAAAALSLSRLIVSCYMLTLYLRASKERLVTVVLMRPADWQRGFHLVRSLWS